MSCRRHETLRESVVSRELDGGGHMWVVPRPGHRCHATLSVEFGALHEAGAEAGEPAGIAHFLEHRLFEKPGGDMSERFTDIGAEVDAQTGFTATSYSVTCGAEVFVPAVKLLFELVGEAHFPDDPVIRERAIVGHEIQLFDDNVEWVSFQMLLAALYPQQRLAIDIAGTPEGLLAIDGAMLERCHARHYHPSAMQLFACGPIDVDGLGQTASRALRSWPQSGSGAPPIARAQSQPGAESMPMSLARPRRLLAFADETPRHGLGLLRQELALEMTLDILFGPGSLFFSRHYESGLLDGETFGGEVHMEESYGFCLLGGDADDPQGLQEAILEQLTQARTSDWIEADFERARRRAYGDMVCRWEDADETVGFVESAALRGCHPFEATELYGGDQAVSVGDIRHCLDECLRPDRVAVASVGEQP